VDAPPPALPSKTPANVNEPPTPPPSQRAKVAVNAPKDLSHAQNIDPQGASAPRQTTDPARMGKKPKPSGIDPVKQKKSAPPAAELDPGEGATTKKPGKTKGGDESLPKKEKISDSYVKAELENSPELIARLPDPKNRRAYMEWLEKSHYGKGHGHIIPAMNLDPSLEEFSQETGIHLEPKK